MNTPFNRPYTSPNATHLLASNDQTSCRSVGTVLSYNPKTKTYRVRVLNHGDKECRSMSPGGVHYGYPIDAQVVVSKFNGTNWVIEAELDRISPRTGPLATAVREGEEDITVDRVGPNQQLLNTGEALPSFRQVDEDGRAEAALRPGDTILQNRTPRIQDRSFAKILASGDVVLRAANEVSLRLFRLRGILRMRARRFIRETLGFFEEVALSDTGRTWREQFIRSRTTTPNVDVVEREGYLGTGVADTGKKITTGTLTVEQDSDTGTLRITDTSTDVSLELGNFVAENAAHPVTGASGAGEVAINGVPVGGGIRLRSGDRELILSPESFQVKQNGQTVTVNDSEISLVKGAESLVLSDTGLVANVTNFEVNATGEANITASVINLNN